VRHAPAAGLIVPVYEYVCLSCGNEVEVLHGRDDSGPGACDVCGGPMRKRIARPAIVFRGSGWAKKERREAATTAAADQRGDKAKAGGTGADKSDAGSDERKPATKESGETAGKGTSTASPGKEATAG
jgi:putative FmdB family regulatory protein